MPTVRLLSLSLRAQVASEKEVNKAVALENTRAKAEGRVRAGPTSSREFAAARSPLTSLVGRFSYLSASLALQKPREVRVKGVAPGAPAPPVKAEAKKKPAAKAGASRAGASAPSTAKSALDKARSGESCTPRNRTQA